MRLHSLPQFRSYMHLAIPVHNLSLSPSSSLSPAEYAASNFE